MLRDAGAQRVGLEADTVTWSQQRRWAGELLADRDLVATRGLVEGLRLVKDPGRGRPHPSRLCDRRRGARDRAGPPARRAHRDASSRQELDAAMRRLGADDLSFETIVASGPNGARPHHHPGGSRHRRGRPGGGRLRGARRRVPLRHDPDLRRRRCRTRTRAACSRSSPRHSRSGWRPSSPVATLPRSTRRVGRSSTTPAGVRRSLTAPATASGSTSTRSRGSRPARLLPSSPATSSPSSRACTCRGLGGVRIEDTVLVTEDGCERLTLAPKQPRPV